MFFDWWFLDDGSFNLEFELNFVENEGISILVVVRNFGCGLSCEYVVWVLVDYGI